MDRGIVLVSFGTSDLDGIKKSIKNIENNIGKYFKEYDIFRAFTSKFIINRLKGQNIEIKDLEEVLEELKKLKYKEVIIQPMHIISGKEYHKVEEIYRKFKDEFSYIKLGEPLFYFENGKGRESDFKLFMESMDAVINKEENILFFGHGSSHESSILYSEFYEYLKKEGYNNILVGTMEGRLSIENIIVEMKEKNIKEISLIPLMISCGYHVKGDMIGDSGNSWKNKLEKAGIKINPKLKGLGEYESFIKLYLNKIKFLKNEYIY